MRRFISAKIVSVSDRPQHHAALWSIPFLQSMEAKRAHTAYVLHTYHLLAAGDLEAIYAESSEVNREGADKAGFMRLLRTFKDILDRCTARQKELLEIALVYHDAAYAYLPRPLRFHRDASFRYILEHKAQLVRRHQLTETEFDMVGALVRYHGVTNDTGSSFVVADTLQVFGRGLLDLHLLVDFCDCGGSVTEGSGERLPSRLNVPALVSMLEFDREVPGFIAGKASFYEYRIRHYFCPAVFLHVDGALQEELRRLVEDQMNVDHRFEPFLHEGLIVSSFNVFRGIFEHACAMSVVAGARLLFAWLKLLAEVDSRMLPEKFIFDNEERFLGAYADQVYGPLAELIAGQLERQVPVVVAGAELVVWGAFAFKRERNLIGQEVILFFERGAD